MQPLFINNWTTELLAPLSAEAETMTVEASKAGALGSLAGRYCVLTLSSKDASDDDSGEIVKAVAVAGGNITLQRHQEGTEAREWPAGTRVSAYWTAGVGEALLAAANAGGGASGAYTVTVLWGGSEASAGGELVGLYPVDAGSNTPGQIERYAYLLEDDIGFSGLGLLPGYVVGRVLTAGADSGAPVEVQIGGTCTLADLQADVGALPVGALGDLVGSPVCLLGGNDGHGVDASFGVAVGSTYLNGRGPLGEAPASASDLRVTAIVIVGYLSSGQGLGTVTLSPQPTLIDMAANGGDGSGSLTAADLLQPGSVSFQLVGSLAAPFTLRAIAQSLPEPPTRQARFVLERKADGTYAWRDSADPLSTTWGAAMQSLPRSVVPNVWGSWAAAWHEMACGYADGAFAIGEQVIQQHHYLKAATAGTTTVELPAGFHETVRDAYNQSGVEQLGGDPDLFVEVTVAAGNARTWRFEAGAGASLYPVGAIELSAPGHHVRFRCDPRTGVWYASGNWA